MGRWSLEQSGSAPQRFAGLTVSVALEVGVVLAEQLLGAAVGAELAAAAAAPIGERGGRGGCSAALLGAAGAGPYPQAIDLRSALGAQVSAGVAVAEVLAIGKGLAAAHHLQLDVLAAPENLGDSAALTVCVHHLQGHFQAHGRLGGQLPAKSCSITLQLWLLAWPGSG